MFWLGTIKLKKAEISGAFRRKWPLLVSYLAEKGSFIGKLFFEKRRFFLRRKKSTFWGCFRRFGAKWSKKAHFLTLFYKCQKVKWVITHRSALLARKRDGRIWGIYAFFLSKNPRIFAFWLLLPSSYKSFFFNFFYIFLFELVVRPPGGIYTFVSIPLYI